MHRWKQKNNLKLFIFITMSTREIIMDSEKLHKVLARAGLGSRREIETWIEAGRVSVNQHRASLGERITRHDKVLLDGRYLSERDLFPQEFEILCYHKPEGEVTTRHDPEGRPTVFHALPRPRSGKWIAVGRLDFNTAGLLLFTTNGELANQLMHPSAGIEREYAVRVLGHVSDEALQRLRDGVQLEDGPARFARVVDAGGEGANHWYHVILTEGRNREVRRLWESVGITVSRLIRIRFGVITLPAWLRKGRFMRLDATMSAALLAQIHYQGTVYTPQTQHKVAKTARKLHRAPLRHKPGKS